jgi:hypothetical protein
MNMFGMLATVQHPDGSSYNALDFGKLPGRDNPKEAVC